MEISDNLEACSLDDDVNSAVGDKKIEDEALKEETDDEEEGEHVQEALFVPPLYRQRYHHVAQLLRQETVKSVVDFGCAECKFLAYLKEVDSVEEAFGVDIERYLLSDHTQMIRPLMGDYLKRRQQPLEYHLMCGSIVDKDSRLRHVEAVTLIEVIEHFENATLHAFPATVFGWLAPRVVIITTPNSEYNVVFPNFEGFRHYDHKFEWTRQEFQNWCEVVGEQYGYSVEYGGMGDAPNSHPDVGYCSQMAIFRKNGDWKYIEALKPDTDLPESCPYELVAESSFPYEPKKSVEETLLIEAEYNLRSLGYSLWQDYMYGESASGRGSEQRPGDLDPESVLVSLGTLLSCHRIESLGVTEDHLRSVLQSRGHTLTSDGKAVIYKHEEDEDNISDCNSEDFLGNGATCTNNIEINDTTSNDNSPDIQLGEWSDEWETEDVETPDSDGDRAPSPSGRSVGDWDSAEQVCVESRFSYKQHMHGKDEQERKIGSLSNFGLPVSPPLIPVDADDFEDAEEPFDIPHCFCDDDLTLGGLRGTGALTNGFMLPTEQYTLSRNDYSLCHFSQGDSLFNPSDSHPITSWTARLRYKHGLLVPSSVRRSAVPPSEQFEDGDET